MIPARMASSRFPGKPLVDLAGKPMIQWVFEAAVASKRVDHVVIATPDAEIAEAASKFGADVCLTLDTHPSGTDRLAEVADKFDADVYLNIQGDEPLMPTENVDRLAALMDEAEMASLYIFCAPEEEENPAVVKVVTSLEGFALYFSRFSIPYARNPRLEPLKRHLGLYGYRKEVLKAFASWAPSGLELTEGLEQLRFLEHGVKIKMGLGIESGTGVDTPEQAALARQLLGS